MFRELYFLGLPVVTMLGFHGFSHLVLAVTMLGFCESLLFCIDCSGAYPDGLDSFIVLPRVVVGLSDECSFETSLMEAVTVVETTDLVAMDELLATVVAVMITFDLCKRRTNLKGSGGSTHG